jgi:CarD family transcriptional regulator
MKAQKVAFRSTPFSRAIGSRTKIKQPAKAPEFKVGDKVVYPGHGVGVVRSVESKEIAGSSISFYMIRILESGVTVMVPLAKVLSVGLRAVAGPTDVKKVFTMLKDKKVVVEQTTWNRRHREYMEKIKTGSIFEITEVLRDLCVIREDKILSFGEKKMLELGKGLLVKELAISQGTDEPTVEAKIEGMFKKKQ